MTKLRDVQLSKIWLAGAAGGLASWLVSAPSELVKCRAQLVVGGDASSLAVFRKTWHHGGLRALYFGGGLTSVRDSVGYGFYFFSYELSRRLIDTNARNTFLHTDTANVLLSGGIAGVVTWASIYPLDVVKTRLQTQKLVRTTPEQGSLLGNAHAPRGALRIAREMYASEGISSFYRGLAVCSIRAFIVNAVQVCPSQRLSRLR